jgi:arylsulfatase
MVDSDAGTLLCFGNSAGGYGLFVGQGRLLYVYNRCGELSVLRSNSPLPAGRHRLGFEFRKTGVLQGVGRLLLDGQLLAEAEFDRLLRRATLGSFRIGRAAAPPLFEEPCAAQDFSGQIEQIVFVLLDSSEAGAAALYID